MRVKTRFSVLIHCNDQGEEARLGRTLESLRSADQVVVVDHQGSKDTRRTAREYGARLIPAVPGVGRGAYAVDCAHDWILCLLPGEIVDESLEASLLEFKQEPRDEVAGYAVQRRTETPTGWQHEPLQMRLVDRRKLNWPDLFPAMTGGPPTMPGEIVTPR